MRRRVAARRRTATGAVQAGGNIRVAIIQPATEPNPLLVQDEGGAGLLGSTGEFLSFSNAQARARAAPRRELGAERGRNGLDVQDPPGRHVPQRRDADRERRQDDVRDARSTRRTARPTRSRRSAASSRRGTPRHPTTRPSSSISTRRTATSPRSSARPTTTRSSSRPTSTPPTGARRSTAPGPSSSTASRRRSAPSSCATTPTGARRRTPTRWSSSSTTKRGR